MKALFRTAGFARNTLLGCAALLALSGEAAAQNYEASESSAGGGQVIATVYYTNSAKGFDASGDSVDIADYQKLELYLLAEYEVADRLTLVFKPSFSDISVEGPGGDSSGLGYTDLGARYNFAEGEGWFLAAEGLLRIPGEDRLDNIPQASRSGEEYDLRLRGFKDLSGGGFPGFVDLQGSYRLRSGNPPNEFHLDATVGVRPSDDLLLMAQSFNTISDGAGQGIFNDYRYHNVQLSAVQSVGGGVSLQAGLVGSVAGENALRERGVFGGLWVSF